jgi:hypothetical protein
MVSSRPQLSQALYSGTSVQSVAAAVSARAKLDNHKIEPQVIYIIAIHRHTSHKRRAYDFSWYAEDSQRPKDQTCMFRRCKMPNREAC